VHSSQRAHRAAEAEERVAPTGRGQDSQQVVAHEVAERADLARGRRISAQEPPRHAHGADGDARGRRDAARADLGELQAAAAEVADDALLYRQLAHRRERAQAGLFPIAQQSHVRSIPLLQDLQQAVSIRGVPHGRRRHGHESKRGAIDTEALEEPADGRQRQRDRVGRELAGAPVAETGLDPLLLQHAVPHAGIDSRQDEARRIGPEIQEREELGHVPSVSNGATRVKSHDCYDVIHRRPPT
jgi:hypothetical protein